MIRSSFKRKIAANSVIIEKTNKKARRIKMSNKSMAKVELHVHLDGSVRPTTIWELGKKRGFISSDTNFSEFRKSLCIEEGQQDLTKFLDIFSIFSPVVAGDPEALERIAYEFCEDASKENIIYTEARYCPHLFAHVPGSYTKHDGCLQPVDVIRIINKGLRRGCVDFGVEVKTILCCMRHRPDWSMDILNLCQEFREEGVVGIDLAGDENIVEWDVPTQWEHLKVFEEAKRLNIHRTVHAGENGPAESVREAITKLHAERIGHGYHVLDDEKLYHECRDKGIHFEVCPISSYITGSVDPDWEKHPAMRFARDKTNFSVNTDDTTLTGKPLSGDYDVCLQKIGLSREQIMQANLNAARSTFLPEKEKMELFEKLRKEYDMDEVKYDQEIHTHAQHV